MTTGTSSKSAPMDRRGAPHAEGKRLFASEDGRPRRQEALTNRRAGHLLGRHRKHHAETCCTSRAPLPPPGDARRHILTTRTTSSCSSTRRPMWHRADEVVSKHAGMLVPTNLRAPRRERTRYLRTRESGIFDHHRAPLRKDGVGPRRDRDDGVWSPTARWPRAVPRRRPRPDQTKQNAPAMVQSEKRRRSALSAASHDQQPAAFVATTRCPAAYCLGRSS